MTKTLILKRFDPISAAKLIGVLYFFLGIIQGLFMGAMALFGPGEGKGGFGLIALLAPFGYGALGFVGTLVGAFCYNAVADRVGGLQIEAEELKA
jgi:hypothetical protein